MCASDQGFSLAELMVALAIFGLLAVMGLRNGAEALGRRRLDAATRSLDQGLQRARAEAQRQGSPCGLRLEDRGWAPPRGGSLPACQQTLETLSESSDVNVVALQHNLPEVLRFSSNGLVLDGGMVVLTTHGTSLQRCLVMALPLGIVRLGRYEAGRCEADSTL